MAQTIEAFNQKFELTEEQARKSKFLKNAFGLTGFKKTNVVKLDYNNEFKPAFEYIYNYLINKKQNILKDKIYDILMLESYFNIPKILEEVEKHLLESDYDLNYYVNLYAAKLLYPEKIKDVLDDKILDKAKSEKDIPEKLLKEVGYRNVLDLFIQCLSRARSYIKDSKFYEIMCPKCNLLDSDLD